MKSHSLLIYIVFLIIGVSSCKYDNEIELYPQTVDCDTLNVGYAATIAPIISNSCNGCHGGAAPSANVITDTYEGLKVIADNGRLWGVVNHEPGYLPMPNNLPKLNDCDLAKISVWLNNGALED